MSSPFSPRVLGLIPARYASTRLPGKPLADIAGFPMIEWVYRRVERSLGMAVVATDDGRILEAVTHFGGRAILTSSSHRSGTDRCAEAYSKLLEEGFKPEVVVNVQGDEPFLQGEDLRTLVAAFEDSRVEIATLVRRFRPGEEVSNPSWPKVVTDARGDALLFSRSPIPYARDSARAAELGYLKHIGVYAFRSTRLLEVSSLPPVALEEVEGLEQLRWLHAGLAVRTVLVDDHQVLSVDTPEDLVRANELARHLKL